MHCCLHCLFGFQGILRMGQNRLWEFTGAIWKTTANRKLQSIFALLDGKHNSVFFSKFLFKQEWARQCRWEMLRTVSLCVSCVTASPILEGFVRYSPLWFCNCIQIWAVLHVQRELIKLRKFGSLGLFFSSTWCNFILWSIPQILSCLCRLKVMGFFLKFESRKKMERMKTCLKIGE